MRSFMATKTEAYVDTSALIAFLDRSDSYPSAFSQALLHSTAAGHLRAGHCRGTWLVLRRYDQNRAVQFLNFV